MNKNWDMNRGEEFMEFSKCEKALALVILVLISTVVLAQVYKAGQRDGFQQCQDQF